MLQQARSENLTICYRKKKDYVSFSSVCSVIDNEFRHNIVEVSTITSWIHSYVDNVMTKVMINNRTEH